MSGVPVGPTMGPLAQATLDMVKDSPSAYLQKLNIDTSGDTALNDAIARELEAKEVRAEKAELIDAYFREHNMPLEGFGMKMVQEAEKNELDWRLVAAIAMRESTGGKFACKKVSFNAFGWGSCKINFESHDKAIETVARNLGGNNPRTAHYYDNKTTIQILRAYNPPSIVPKYAEQVISIMDAIGPTDGAEEEEITLTLAS